MLTCQDRHTDKIQVLPLRTSTPGLLRLLLGDQEGRHHDNWGADHCGEPEYPIPRRVLHEYGANDEAENYTVVEFS